MSLPFGGSSVDPTGARGGGGVGIEGTAAAVANAARDATGVRVRDLPPTLDHFPR